MITFNPETWPEGDVFYRIAWAIAHAEGADREGTVPDRFNNPGDISDGRHLYGFVQRDGSEVTTFPSKEKGWQWLHDKLQRIAENASQVYHPLMTWREIAQEWAGDSVSWLKNLTGNYMAPCGRQLGLNVSPDSTFQEYVSRNQG